MSTITTFQQYLQSAFTTGVWSTDEVIEFVLPLFEEVLSFHENSQVGSFEKPDTVFLTDGRLDIDENHTHAPLSNLSDLQKLLDSQHINGYSIAERILIDEDVSQNKASIVNLQIQPNPTGEILYPVYLPGYQCYEIKIGHHDVQTDIFCLGLILGSSIMGLDLYDLEDLNQFVAYRNQPVGLNPRIHPTVSALVTEMTELDRRHRSRDLQEIIQRLKYYRDYDPQRQMDLAKLAAFQINKPSDRRAFILSKLRNRLFDTSRRNRLLYYKPNGKFVNLTVSSVPMVLHYQSINPQLLFTWNKEISSQIIEQKDISLNKYLRFEDHPYLNSQLNSIRHLSENDKKEYGFSQLKLAVAFLHWHNLKENTNERILSPLLLLPVELERKKSIKEERFTLKIIDNAAIINPVLANYLKDLYGITLPDRIDFDDVSMEDFFEMLQTQIAAAKQGIKLNYIDKPRIKVVHTIARQTINTYRKKLKLKGSPAFQQIDYSYSDENYKPLGLELFRLKIQVKQSVLEFILGDVPPAHLENFSDAQNATKGTFHLTDGENNPYSWDFDVCNIVLGNFNYKKMSLVSDYNKVQEEGIQHDVFTQLFSNEPRQLQTCEIENGPAEWHHVITADPTQAKAVMQSRTGKSYIIQGPPGTGKSQTITNLIADFLATGKTVLFICEKRAALDVVYHRLQQNQLAELCCYIHDSQGDKKEFIKDLRTIYEDFLKNKLDLPGVTSQRNFVVDQLISKVSLLKLYHEQQVVVNAQVGISTRLLIEKLVELKTHIPKFEAIEQEATPFYNNWLQFGETINQLGKVLEDIGQGSQFANHPFKNLASALVKVEKQWQLEETRIKENIALKIERNKEKLDGLSIEHENISQKLANCADSLYGWLSEKKKGWEDTIGKVIAEDVLFMKELLPEIINSNESFYGITLRLDELPYKIKTLDQYRAEQNEISQRIDANNKEQQNILIQQSEDLDKIKKKYQPQIKQCKEEWGEQQYIVERNNSQLKERNLLQKDLEIKAKDEKQRALTEVDNLINQTDDLILRARESVQILKNDVDKQIVTKEKEAEKKIALLEKEQNSKLQIIDNEIEKYKIEIVARSEECM